MANQDASQVLDKVRKLLALATSSNPNEAALAAAKAQALMFAHNITRTDIEAAEANDAPGGEYLNETITLEGAKAGSMNWRRLLIHYVARNNFCATVTYRGGPRVGIVGQRHNIELVQYLTGYLMREIERLAKEGWAQLDKRDKADTHWLTWRDAFCKGAVVAVDARLREQRQASEQEAGEQSRALVVLYDQQVQDAKALYYPKLQSANYSRVRNYDAYQAGHEAGKRIPLSQPIDGGAQRQLPGR